MIELCNTYVTNYINQQTLKPDDDYTYGSASSTSLDVRRTRLPTVDDRSLIFPVAAVRLWNSLPSHVTADPLSLHLLLSS